MLNSLAEEKLQASLRCLARHGRFLEIGKFDLSNNSHLGKMGKHLSLGFSCCSAPAGSFLQDSSPVSPKFMLVPGLLGLTCTTGIC